LLTFSQPPELRKAVKIAWLQGEHYEDIIDTSNNGATAALLIAFEAWSHPEKEWWNSATPAQRLQRCTLWESRIRDRSVMPYMSEDAVHH
jgi:hypothetical protein